jgi:hypothetical protein
MTVEFIEQTQQPVLEIRLEGKLTKDDYERLIPEAERMIEDHGKGRLLVIMHDFHGWDVSAAWEDTKFAIKHFNDIEKVAIVGETTWQKGMTAFCKPFTGAEVRFFEEGRLGEARKWVAE